MMRFLNFTQFTRHKKKGFILSFQFDFGTFGCSDSLVSNLFIWTRGISVGVRQNDFNVVLVFWLKF